jgi:hypothetical protein
VVGDPPINWGQANTNHGGKIPKGFNMKSHRC